MTDTTRRTMLFLRRSRIGQSIETERRLVVARGGGWEERGASANGCGASFWGEENILKRTVVMAANSVNVLEATELYTLNSFMNAAKVTATATPAFSRRQRGGQSLHQQNSDVSLETQMAVGAFQSQSTCKLKYLHCF